MNEIIRPCPDCGRDRSLAQLHGVAGRCPDTADVSCPEWYCQLCGAALVIGEAPSAWLPVSAGSVRARVA
jgi:hypothetical protein